MSPNAIATTTTTAEILFSTILATRPTKVVHVFKVRSYRLLYHHGRSTPYNKATAAIDITAGSGLIIQNRFLGWGIRICIPTS